MKIKTSPDPLHSRFLAWLDTDEGNTCHGYYLHLSNAFHAGAAACGGSPWIDAKSSQPDDSITVIGEAKDGEVDAAFIEDGKWHWSGDPEGPSPDIVRYMEMPEGASK